MTVFIRDKVTGHNESYRLIGNISYEGDYIVLVQDPRISMTGYRLPVRYKEIVRITEGQLETPESVEAWVEDEAHASKYIKTVFKEV